MGRHRVPQPLVPERQIHTGPVYDCSPERWRANMGQVNPYVQRRLAAEHGRYLSGLGDNAMEGDDRVETHQELYALEEQDDVYGSGVFDDPRRPGTANSQAGVFASHNSLPGYLARQKPFTFSDEVSSLPSGAAYAEVPAGGMAYVEARGRQVWPRKAGPKPPKPDFGPASPTGRMQPYAYLQQDRHGREMATPLAGTRPDTSSTFVPSGVAPPSPYFPTRGRAMRRPQYRIEQLAQRPRHRRLPSRPKQVMVPMRAYGADPEPNGTTPEPDGRPNWPTYLAIGVGLGAVGFMVFGQKRL